jgi:Cu/Ag efflux protein CusF
MNSKAILIQMTMEFNLSAPTATLVHGRIEHLGWASFTLPFDNHRALLLKWVRRREKGGDNNMIFAYILLNDQKTIRL